MEPPKLVYEWSKAYPIFPRDTLKTHAASFPKFIPSYDRDCEPANINFLLTFEYFRIWQRELAEYFLERKKSVKSQRIKRPKFDKNKNKTKNKKNVDGNAEEKKLFKMKKFEGIGARTDHKGKEPRRTEGNQQKPSHKNVSQNNGKHDDGDVNNLPIVMCGNCGGLQYAEDNFTS